MSSNGEPKDTDSSQWWVYVKYSEDGVKEKLPVTNVFVDKTKTQFCPKSLKDYTPGKPYLCKAVNVKEGTDKKHFWAQIGKIAGKPIWLLRLCLP